MRTPSTRCPEIRPVRGFSYFELFLSAFNDLMRLENGVLSRRRTAEQRLTVSRLVRSEPELSPLLVLAR